MIKFPQNFLWGAALSAYQSEGNNVNSDWWQWEKEAGKENSGMASRHYEFYERDFDLAKSLNHNAHRLSIEWSRIEPEEGKFSEQELKHYVDVILALRARNIEPLITLHHFTNPIWFSKSGGWQNRRSAAIFLRYCNFVTRALAKHVRYWVTINEPTIYITHAYVFGVWPPRIKSYIKARMVENNLVSTHIKTYRMIHKIYKELGLAEPSIGIAHYTQVYVPCTQDLKNRVASYLRDKRYNLGFLDKIMRHKTMDFVGINYYTRQSVEVKKWGMGNIAIDVVKNSPNPVKKNSLGWDIYPEGLYEMLLKMGKYRRPIIITENGICTADDNLRWEYIKDHLKNIHLAMEKGVNVAGYLYWSLIDNFEWDKGFGPRFGLIDIDYKTYKRTVRESAIKFGLVCKTGLL